MSEAPTADAPATTDPTTADPSAAQAIGAELAALDTLLRERGTSVRDLLSVVAKNAYGITDLR